MKKSSFIILFLLHEIRAQGFDLYAVFAEFVAIIPPVRIGGIEYGRGRIWICRQGNSDKFVVTRIKIGEFRVGGKFLVSTLVVRSNPNPKAMVWVCSIGKEPLEEGVARSRLTGRI